MRTLIAVGGAVALALGCGGTAADTAGTEPPRFTAIYASLVPSGTKSKCSFCHSLPPNKISNGNLSMGMDKAAAYASLVGKMSGSATCAGRRLVVPGQPEQSLFFQKFSSTPPCGGRMPLGADPLTDAQLEMVRTWIANGAKDD